MAKSYKELMNGISAFIFDLDGVLTNAQVHVTTSGELLRTMSIRDGYAIKAAIDQGYQICIISGGSNEGVAIRLKNLGVSDVFLGVSDKVSVYQEFLQEKNLSSEQVLFMGDDLPDYNVMKRCQLAACPQDAVAEIKAISHYVSHKNGGYGAARDVIEQVMKIHGKWMNDLNAKYD